MYTSQDAYITQEFINDPLSDELLPNAMVRKQDGNPFTPNELQAILDTVNPGNSSDGLNFTVTEEGHTVNFLYFAEDQSADTTKGWVADIAKALQPLGHLACPYTSSGYSSSVIGSESWSCC